MAESLSIDKSSTALVIIDLQKGIASRETFPYSASVVIGNAAKLAQSFRNNNMPVFLVHVKSSEADRINTIADEQMFARPAQMPADWSEFVPELNRSE